MAQITEVYFQDEEFSSLETIEEKVSFITPVSKALGDSLNNFFGVFSAILCLLSAAILTFWGTFFGGLLTFLAAVYLIGEVVCTRKAKFYSLDASSVLPFLSFVSFLLSVIWVAFAAMEYFDVNLPFDTFVVNNLKFLNENSSQNPVLKYVFIVMGLVFFFNGVVFSRLKNALSKNMPYGHMCLIAAAFNIVLCLMVVFAAYNTLAGYFGIIHVKAFVNYNINQVGLVCSLVLLVLLIALLVLSTIRIFKIRHKLNEVIKFYKN